MGLQIYFQDKCQLEALRNTSDTDLFNLEDMLEKPPTQKVPNLDVVKILMTKSGTRIATIVLPSRGFGLLKGSEAGLNVAKSRNSLAIALVT